MNKIPSVVLIETWLFLASAKTPELESAKKAATENLVRVFGNLDVAQVYCENHRRKLKDYQKYTA